jgi:hypothetical protein
VLVSNRAANTISKIDLQTLSRGRPVPGPGGPDDMELLSDGKTCWSRRAGPASSRMIDTTSQEGRAPGQGGQVAARRVDAGPCSRASKKLGSCARWPSLIGCGRARRGACDKPVYLTFDTGHMGVAPLVAECCKRQQVKAPSSWPTRRR